MVWVTLLLSISVVFDSELRKLYGGSSVFRVVSVLSALFYTACGIGIRACSARYL